MKRGDLISLAIAVVIAIIFIGTGAARLPIGKAAYVHAPVLVYAEPLLDPLVVTAKKIATERGQFRRATAGEALRMRAEGIFPDPRRFARAEPGEEVPISITQYCLKGTTRRGRFVRPGIVAADPRIFPLARYVEVFMGKKYLGRFLVDDTGGNVIGATLDIWTPSCQQAARFGRHYGKAVLVAKEEERILPQTLVELDMIPNLSAIGEMFEGLAKRQP
ncbi:MAG TPA: 3D domain-containing protein [Gemmatimonadaceae bacterium]|jgi:3D (Asp-Asp-Asp) domain-containing protein|nr:3D domain-containing protein [Gemmatimonadaceae bacterium]